MDILNTGNPKCIYFISCFEQSTVPHILNKINVHIPILKISFLIPYKLDIQNLVIKSDENVISLKRFFLVEP